MNNKTHIKKTINQSAKDRDANDEWIIFRVDTQIKNEPVDIYMILVKESDTLVAFKLVDNVMEQNQAEELLQEAIAKRGSLPNKIMLAQGDPAEHALKKVAANYGLKLELATEAYLEKFIAPCKQSFGKQFYSPSTFAYVSNHDEYSREEIKKIIPDSYDLCPCASGKKYKFCCKKILREIAEAMAAAEEGKLNEALEWIAKAKQIVGETAEVLCREAIVYSFFSEQKSAALLAKCLTINPNHPRAHYLRGINLKEAGNLHEAVTAYEMAIKNYPASDHYHLNEAYNNLGGVFYAMGDLAKAKSTWEKALLYMPQDKLTRQNLIDFIYNNSKQIL